MRLVTGLMYLASLCSVAQAEPEETAGARTYNLAFSGYLGGSRNDEMGDIAVDRRGNVYVTGWTWSADFPTTPGAYDTTFDGGPGGRVDTDGYVMKIDPNGKLLWSTLIGGPNTDLTYSIAVDEQGYVYVTGMGGKGFPVTRNASQPTWKGHNAGIYGDINAVVVKLEPDGSDVVWSSYWGTAGQIRDLDIGPSGDVFVIHGHVPSLGQALFPSAWLTNAFQRFPRGDADVVLARIRSDGSNVAWATYLGGSDRDSQGGSIAVDGSGYVYVATATRSTDIPTPNGYDRTYNGAGDTYVAKLTPDGTSVLWGTYLGGSDTDGASGKHGIAVARDGMVYVASHTSSADFPTSPGAYDRTYNGGRSGGWEQKGDRAVTKLTTDGRLVASTFVGADQRDGGEGIALDGQGNVYLAMFTFSDDFPVTAGAFQASPSGSQDGAFCMLSTDLSRLRYSSYMGTNARDSFRAVATDSGGNFYVAGTTESTTWPTKNALQATNRGGRDCTVVKFTPGR